MKIALRLALLLVIASAPRQGTAQWLDRAAQSPAALMNVPPDGVAYYQARQRANQLLAQRDFAGAESVFVRLAKEYPRDGGNWLRLIQAQLGLKKFADASRSFDQMGRVIGWGPPYNSGVNTVRFSLAAGDTAKALEKLATEIFERHGFQRQVLYDEAEFAPLRENQEFKRLTAHPDTQGWSRDEGWRHDIDFVYEEIARTSPDYRAGSLPAEFVRRYRQLKADVPKLSDEELYIGLSRMLAVLRAGHTALFPVGTRFLPFRPYAFPEGIFIVESSDATLLGARIVSIGRLSVDSILKLFAQSKGGDGDMEILWQVNAVAQTHVLKGLGAISRVDSVSLVLETREGAKRTVTLATSATAPKERQDRLVAPPGVTPPLFVQQLGQMHWEQALPEYDALYVQINNIRNDPDETLAAFGLRIGSLLDATRPKNVIIDVRHNNGGNTNLYTELLRSLIAYTRAPGTQVYTLIGRRSYSATGNFITDLERLVRPIWVGEASSECCNLHGDPTPVTLPYSRIQGEFSVVRWNLSQNAFDERREMSPDVPVQLTAKAYFAGQDPALDATLRLIKEKTVRP